MNNIQTIASAIPTGVQAGEAGRRITGNGGGIDLRALSSSTHQAFLDAQAAYATAVRTAQAEIVDAEIKQLVRELGLSGASA